MFIATINEYTGENAKEDRSGNMPLILNVLGGKCPNKRMISLGWADTQGMEVGKTYLIRDEEIASHPEYGRQFTFHKVQEVSALEIVEFCDKHPVKIYDSSNVTSKIDESKFVHN